VFLFGSLLLPIASASFTDPTGIPFEDVPRGRWDHGHVSWAWINNITTGTSQTTFSPTSNVTRGEFVTFLYRVDGEPLVSGPHPFRDVPAGRFFSTPVLWAYLKDITTGTSSTAFSPNDNITRQQLVTFLYRYIGEYLGMDVWAPLDVINNAQLSTISLFARPAMRWGVHKGIIGVGAPLNPQGFATRSEAMAMIKRVVDEYKLSIAKTWTPPFQTVPMLDPRYISIKPMIPTSVIGGTLTVAMPLVGDNFTISDAGMHRFVLTGLEQVGRRVQIKVLIDPGSGWVELTDWIPLGYREGHGLELLPGDYRVLIERHEGSLGTFELSIFKQKPMETVSNTADRDDIKIISISDYMEFERQHNDYLFETPTTTGTGLPNPSGIYRFDLTTVPFEAGIRSTIRLEVFLARGMVPVVGPIDLALFDGINGELRDNETYIVRTTQIPIAGGSSGTVMSATTPYTLQVSPQKNVTRITPMSTNAAISELRKSVVNDSFQFVGQMNTYEFIAPSTGTFQFRPNLMPGTSRSVFRISDPWGNVHSQTIGVREGISQNLIAGVTYRMHVIHQIGHPIGAYSFTIVYP